MAFRLGWRRCTRGEATTENFVFYQSSATLHSLASHTPFVASARIHRLPLHMWFIFINFFGMQRIHSRKEHTKN